MYILVFLDQIHKHKQPSTQSFKSIESYMINKLIISNIEGIPKRVKFQAVLGKFSTYYHSDTFSKDRLCTYTFFY